MIAPQQLEFPSLAFPKDRTVLTVSEVAERFECTAQHIIDLLEEGRLAGFDIAGRQDFIRVAAAAIDAIVKRSQRGPLSREELLQILRDTKPQRRTTRAHWRIPVEGYNGFLRENHSLRG
jgi:hypothetical protein